MCILLIYCDSFFPLSLLSNVSCTARAHSCGVHKHCLISRAWCVVGPQGTLAEYMAE